MSGTPRILTLDIETAPAHALVFSQYKVNISNVQIIQPDRVIAFAAKWHDDSEVLFFSEWHDGRRTMLEQFDKLLSEADIVVHFNGRSFDMPWIRRELVLAGFQPHAPVQEIDLLKIAQNRFRFMNNKLENLAVMFGVGEKLENGGFKLWRDIEVGSLQEKTEAWALMREYNMRDVEVTERLYDAMRPWIPNHPHMGLFDNDPAETDHGQTCGSDHLQDRGWAFTTLGKYPRVRCRSCGKWGRRKRSVAMVDARGTQ